MVRVPGGVDRGDRDGSVGRQSLPDVAAEVIASRDVPLIAADDSVLFLYQPRRLYVPCAAPRNILVS
jgi:hypothetical protein